MLVLHWYLYFAYLSGLFGYIDWRIVLPSTTRDMASFDRGPTVHWIYTRWILWMDVLHYLLTVLRYYSPCSFFQPCSTSCFESSIQYLFIVSWILLQKVTSRKVIFVLRFAFSADHILELVIEIAAWFPARNFFNSFREDHEMMHSHDLQKLEGVLSPSHLEVNYYPNYILLVSLACLKFKCNDSSLIVCDRDRRWNSHILWGKAKLT